MNAAILLAILFAVVWLVTQPRRAPRLLGWCLFIGAGLIVLAGR